ncbi:retrotransposon protein, putative, ty1-copia subclass [Tanacetum coccineum]|uniref:Retrotransposon protein, putative, ty1-copia subclass n=1 Tax=Tanacetum coccineum TaxID=301880 RepID=A0ABQ5CMS6_9ASTR
MKKLRTDNGLKFCNQEFNNLCKESGIARHLTVAETPQQNGLAGRMKRTLLNKVRCLLIQSGLPDSFWAKAMVTAAYLINRSPSTALEKKKPMDLWSGHPANYEMLRIFGCVAYSHMNQGKLKPRVIKCIFLGYPDGVKGYRLWRLDNVKLKIIISKDVVFNESLMYKDTLKGVGAVDSGKGNLDNYVLVHDRSKRTTTIPARYRDEGDVSFSRPSVSKIFAMKEEMNSIKKNHTWELVNQPPGQKLRAWIDYNEVFSLVVRHTSIRVILSLTACEDYELEQLDMKMTFLHGNLDETIYMRQPPGFEEGTGNKACLLKKSLYGLKQSPRQWYKRFDVYMISNGFSRSNYDSCVYFKEFAPGMYIYLLLYVDDMLIACKSKSEIEYTKGLLRKEFDMKELGPARKILGMEIVRDRGSRTLKVSQSGYVQKILNNYRMDNGKSVSVPLGAHFKVSLKDCPSNDWDVERMSKVPYANVVGSLMYLMVCTRPDIAYAVSIVSRYLANPGLVYGRDQGKHVDVDGFVDADYAKDPDKLKGLLIELGVNLRSVVVNCDNQSEIHLSRNAMFHERMKHVNVRYHFIREIVESKEIKVAKIGTKDNAADAFTKVVPERVCSQQPTLLPDFLRMLFPLLNILNYTSVSWIISRFIEKSSFQYSSENSKDNMIPPVFSSFYNNPCLKDVQAFYAKELPISSQRFYLLPQLFDAISVIPPYYYLILDISLFLKNYYHLRSESVPHLLPQLRYQIHLGIKHYPPTKWTSNIETPAITLAAIQQLINDGISSALKAQAASMASASNPNRNTGPTRTPVAKTGN